MTEWIISSAVLIVVVALVRQLLKGKISLRLQYALWAIVLVRLLVPITFGESKISVLNVLDQDASVVEQQEPAEEPTVSDPGWEPIEGSPAPIPTAPVGTPVVTPGATIDPDPVISELPEPVMPIVPDPGMNSDPVTEPEPPAVDEPSGAPTVSLAQILTPFWLCGIAVVALWFLISNFSFWLRLRRSRQLLELDCPIRVYVTGAVETPCLFGLIRPAVYLTPEVAEDEVTMRHVLAHELTHYRHWDHIWSVLRCICLAVHWYNPLVWLAASLSRRDAELACDESTIRRIGEEERTAYGRTLIGLTCVHRSNLLHTATTMTGSKKSIKERIVLIAKKPKMATYTLVAVILIAAIAVGCTFTGAKKKEGLSRLTKIDKDSITLALINGLCKLPEEQYGELVDLLHRAAEQPVLKEELTAEAGDYSDGVEYAMTVTFDGDTCIIGCIPEDDGGAELWVHTFGLGTDPEEYTLYWIEFDELYQFIIDVFNREMAEVEVKNDDPKPTVDPELTINPNIWKQVEDYAIEAFLDIRPLGENERMELRYVEAFHVPIHGENSAVCIYIARYSYEREQIYGQWYDRRPSLNLIVLWEDLDTDSPRFTPLGYRHTFGGSMDLDNSMVLAQVEEVLQSYEGEIPAQTIDQACEGIVFPASEPVAAAQTFAASYAASIVTTEPGNFYSVTDCTVLDWTLEEITTEYNRMKISFKLGLLPADNLNNFVISGAQVGEGQDEGWYTMEREVVLDLREDGLWHCMAIGSDLPNVGMSYEYFLEAWVIPAGMNAAAHANDATGYALLDPWKMDTGTEFVTGYEAMVYETGATEEERMYHFYGYQARNDGSGANKISSLSVPAAYSTLYCGDSNELIVAGEHEGEKWAYRVYIDDRDLRYEEISYPADLPEKVEFVPLEQNAEPAQPSDPNAELIAYFQDLLTWDGGTTHFNGAMTCAFDSPKDINLEYVFYTGFPGGEGWSDFTEEEKAYLIAEGMRREIEVQKRPAWQLEQALQAYFGVALSQVQIPDSWVYYETTDSYYSGHSDTHVMERFTVTKVEQGEDGLVYVYYTAEGPIYRQDGTTLDGWEHEMVLTLQIQASRLTNPHGYAVVANQTLSDFEAFTTAAAKAVDPAQISVRAKTPYQAAGNYVAAWGEAYTAQMPYFIRNYRLIDWGVEEISADGKAVSGWLYCSILPTREYDAEGGIQFSAGNAGYLYGSFSFVLEEQDGIWTVAGWDKLEGISLEDCGYTPMEGIEATVTGFLNEYLTELYCYTNSKWLDYTTGGIHIYEVDELSEEDQAIVWAANQNISYLEDKATYWKLARRGTNHTDFAIKYGDMKISQKGNRTTVNVDARMSFVYQGETDWSSLQESYEIQLAKINGVWLITDVMQEVFWFDYEYKNNREALDKEIEYWESFSTSKIQRYDLNGDGMIQSVEFPYAEGEAFGLTGEYATLYTAVAEYVMRGSGNVLGGRDLTLPRITRVYGKYEDKDGNMNYICGMNTMYYYGLGSAPGQWPANHTGGAGDFVLATLDSDGNLVGFKTWPDSPGTELAQKLYREYCGPLENLAEAFINGTEDAYAEELMTEYKNEGPRLAQYLSYYFGE